MTKQKPPKPTRGQLERTLSQQFQKLYREHLGHSTGKVCCELSENRLTIIVEDSLTQPEKLLLEKSDSKLTEQVRDDLDEAIRPEIIKLVEGVLDQKVADIMSDTTLETGRTGVMVVLADEAEAPTSEAANTIEVDFDKAS
ncbi:MAG: DUF2294 domain-containing protein [Nodosilinea sp.]